MTPPPDTVTQPKRMLGRTPLIDLGLNLLIAAACALRIYNVIAHNPLDHLWSDPLRHWEHASAPTVPSPMALFDPPVYQVWLSIVQRMCMQIPGLVALHVGALSVITPWLWYRFLREAVASRQLALLGWAALGLLPSWVGIYSYFMTETLFLPSLGLSLWMSLRARRKADVPSFILMVAAWLFCALTRPVAIPAAALFVSSLWFFHPQKIRTAIWSAVLLASVLAPISVRNHAYYGIWAPHGNGWLNKIYAESGARVIELHFTKKGARWEYGFGSPSIDSTPFSPLSNWTSRRQGTVHVNIDFENGAVDWKKAYEANRLKGAALWKLRWENLAFLFFGNSWPDNNPRYPVDAIANHTRWLWAPLTVVLGILTLACWRQVLRRPLLPAAIALWIFCQGWLLLVPNEGRYRKPIEGLLVAYTLVLADTCFRRKTPPQTATATPVS